METIASINAAINNFVWGISAMVCILGIGLYLSIRTGFIQIRKFGLAMKETFLILYSLVAILGATVNLGLIWEVAETFNGLMAIPNLIGVFLLSGTVIKLIKNYFSDEEYVPYHAEDKSKGAE